MNIIQIYKKFPTQDDCLAYLEKVRWNNQPICPYCNSSNHTSLKKEHRYHCNNCNTSYSVTVKTIFHKTKVDLQKWFLAISIMLNAKKGLSARQLARDIEVNKNTAWYMAMRIRKAMNEKQELLKGLIEIDDTYIGGDNGGNEGSTPPKRGRGTSKTPIVGMIERGGRVVARPVKDLTYQSLRSIIKEHIDLETATVITDEFRGYSPISSIVEHKTINHSKWYVEGDIHTNSIESFWALFKRGIVGQYHKVSLRYLQRYIDEFCYRHNNRKDLNVFDLTIARALNG